MTDETWNKILDQTGACYMYSMYSKVLYRNTMVGMFLQRRQRLELR